MNDSFEKEEDELSLVKMRKTANSRALALPPLSDFNDQFSNSPIKNVDKGKEREDIIGSSLPAASWLQEGSG